MCNFALQKEENMQDKRTYIAFDAIGVADPTNSNLHYFHQLSDWQKGFPKRFDFVNMPEINFSAEHQDLLDSTLKHRLLKRMAEADNALVIVSPVTNTESEILNWQISRCVNRFHLPVIIAYAGLDVVDDSTIKDYWTWLPNKFKKYITRNSWARMAHVPFTRDKIERAIATYSLANQSYPWDSETIF